jgi:DNA-binding transcriptional LysR family regulator
MDIETLKTFCVVANQKSFMKAAEILNITQSGISRRIQSLENEMGTTLLVRTPQSVTLTKKGKGFLPYAERTVQIFQEGEKRIINNNNEETLTIAAPPAASVTLLPKILKAFHNEHGIHVSVNTAPSQHIFDMLIDQTINVGFTSAVFPSTLLEYERVYEEEVVCVGHPDFVKQYIIDKKIIKHPIPIILNYMNIEPWDSINQHFQNNPQFVNVMSVFYIDVIEKLARMGVGLAMLPISLVNEGLTQGDLVKVSLPKVDIHPKSVYLATYKNIQRDYLTSQFIKTVKRVMSNESLV